MLLRQVQRPIRKKPFLQNCAHLIDIEMEQADLHFGEFHLWTFSAGCGLVLDGSSIAKVPLVELHACPPYITFSVFQRKSNKSVGVTTLLLSAQIPLLHRALLLLINQNVPYICGLGLLRATVQNMTDPGRSTATTVQETWSTEDHQTYVEFSKTPVSERAAPVNKYTYFIPNSLVDQRMDAAILDVAARCSSRFRVDAFSGVHNVLLVILKRMR